MLATSHVHRARRPRRKPGAWCIAVVCLVAQLLGWVHLIAVEHARCPEHGEVLHTQERSAGASLVRALHAEDAEDATDARASTSVDAAPSEQHADDHCGWLAERRDARLSPAITVEAVSPPELSSLLAFEPPVRASSALLYRLAPKQSPPTWS